MSAELPPEHPVGAELRAGLRSIIARYPQARSALLPMLHLVQAEFGYVTPEGIEGIYARWTEIRVAAARRRVAGAPEAALREAEDGLRAHAALG